MTWLQLVQTDYIITTGDGAKFTPKWLNAQTAKQYNYTEFLFVGVQGSFVNRQLPKGARYPIEIYFDGADCITEGLRFYKSADNSNAWKIQHPYYGNVLVQPLDISLDNSVYNVSKITCTLIETNEYALINKASVSSIVAAQAQAVQSGLTAQYQTVIPIPSSVDYASQSLNVTSVFNSIKDTIQDSTQYTNFVNAYNSFNAVISTINEAVNQGKQAIGYANFICSMPANFTNTVISRFAQLRAAVLSLQVDAATFTAHQKLLYQSLAGVIQSAFCVASVTNITTDYDNVDSIYGAIDVIVTNYNEYMANLDLLQTANGGQTNSYIPTPENLQAITDLFLYTCQSLFDLAANAKIKHTIYLPEASNLILVAFNYIGLAADDSTIDAIISMNNITLDEYQLLPKGRKITYYA